MKKIVVFILSMIGVSVFLSAALFFWQAKDYYFPEINKITADYETQYDVQVVSVSPYTAPVLPDISGYTVEALQAKIPELQAGKIEVQKLKDAYPEIRRQIADYSDMQDRLDPIAIYITDGVVSLENIVSQIEDTKLIEEHLDSSFILHVPLVVSAEASLVIQKGETILMSATEGAFLSIMGQGFMDGATIIGWDIAQDTPMEFNQAEIFRPYIVASCGARLDMAETDFAHLGYKAKNASGLSYVSCKDKPDISSAKGWVIGNDIEGLYAGFNTDNATEIILINNEFTNNITQGISLSNISHHIIAAQNKVSGTVAENGIIITNKSSNNFIADNVLEGNAGSGIYVSNNSLNNLVVQNTLSDNGEDGISFYESPDNILYQNIMVGNKGAGLRVRNSWDIKSYQDKFEGNKNYAIQLYTQALEGRDLVLNPYLEEAGLVVQDSQIKPQPKAVFKVEDFDSLEIINMKVTPPSSKIFSGDLKGVGQDVFSADTGLMIKKKATY